MKNIQVIDGALNATYSLFAATESEFRTLFPDGQDIAFADELWERLGQRTAQAILEQIWQRPVWKPSVRGIHGTLFFGLDSKKAYYPSRREAEVDPTGLNEAQRQLYARMRA